MTDYNMTLLKILLVFLLIYLGLRLFSRYVFPFLVQRIVKRLEKNMQNGFTQQQHQQPTYNQPPKDEVTIEYNNKNSENKLFDKDDGEYIDYEEVD